jgi:uncharacterized protein
MNKRPNCLSSREQEALSQFVVRLRERLDDNITKIVLFGSRARGEGTEDSDIDLLVLLQCMDHALRREILDLAADIFIDMEINLSPLVMKSDHYAWLKSIERGIALEIERDGVEL